jgi:hypothetical protein
MSVIPVGLLIIFLVCCALHILFFAESDIVKGIKDVSNKRVFTEDPEDIERLPERNMDEFGFLLLHDDFIDDPHGDGHGN